MEPQEKVCCYDNTRHGCEYKEENKKTFKVDSRSNKTEIKQAIEKLFNVKVEEIRTINVKPKKRRVGRYAGLTNRTKKAIVTLAEGQSIELN